MNEVLDTVQQLSQDVCRNITNVSFMASAFNDLLEEDTDAKLADKLVSEADTGLSLSSVTSDFYYTAAISYPFETEPFMSSRYSDGTFPVWYGSLDMETTIYETVHHSIKSVLNIEGVQEEGTIIKRRTVFDVYCQAILFDLVSKTKKLNQLTSDNYSFCQKIGKRLSSGGYPGVLSRSARCKGVNVNLFTDSVLQNPRVSQNLSYIIEIDSSTVYVNDEADSTILNIRF